MGTLSYTLFSFSLSSLYSFPSSDHPEHSLLSLLLSLAQQHPHSDLRCRILALLSHLLELGGFPVRPSFHSAARLIYASLQQQCDAAMRGDFDEMELFEVVRLATTLGGFLSSLSPSARGAVAAGPRWLS